MKFKSVAYWPLSAHSTILCRKTEDTHETRELANGVCRLLEKHGYGGDGKIFPVKTEVIEMP